MQLKKEIALFLCLLLCMQVLTGSVFATDANVKSISGGGVKVLVFARERCMIPAISFVLYP